MADNINTLPSTDVAAVPVATDEVGGAHYQIIKTAFGADGVATGVEDVNGSRFPVGGAQIGATNETAPATDTATAGINGRLQRVAQRLTTLLSILPPSIGNQTAGDSLGVTLSDDNYLQLGAQNETAPANDTAMAGLNGRLQRIAQRLTSLIAQIPAALGQATMANSLAVVLASDQTAVPQKGAVTTVQLTVAVGTSQSNAGDIRGYAPTGIFVPSTFDGTTINFEVSWDNSSWYTLYDLGNNLVTIPSMTANRAYPLFGEMSGWSYLRINTGSTQTTTSTVFTIQLNSVR